MEQLARFLERDHESAARSLREGMAEMLTLQRLKLPPSLYECWATTNIIESPQGGVARRTGNVTRWRDQEMVERWVASAELLTESHFRKLNGHKDLWALVSATIPKMQGDRANSYCDSNPTVPRGTLE